MADLTLVNLNMLLVRYIDAIERELHVPLGPLYLTSSLEAPLRPEPWPTSAATRRPSSA